MSVKLPYIRLVYMFAMNRVRSGVICISGCPAWFGVMVAVAMAAPVSLEFPYDLTYAYTIINRAYARLFFKAIFQFTGTVNDSAGSSIERIMYILLIICPVFL